MSKSKQKITRVLCDSGEVPLQVKRGQTLQDVAGRVQMSADYSKMTRDEFNEILADIVHESVGELLSIPGVYEAVSEHFNNEVLERWEEAHPDARRITDKMVQAARAVLFGE